MLSGGAANMRRTKIIHSLVLAMSMTIGGGLQSHEIVAEQAMPSVLAVTELKSSGNGHFIVTASINGTDVRAIVDTGATAVVLGYDDAQKVGLRPGSLDYDVQVQTANGIGKAARVTLREIEIDTVRVSDVEGLVLEDGALNGTLLGMSFLSKLRSFQVENGRLVLKN
jgi:aspartyl protease family protein